MPATTPSTQCTADGERRLYLAFDLGNTTWTLAFATAFAETPRVRTVPARDLDALGKEILSAKLRFHLPIDAPVWSCYEAGRDGFWLHRELARRAITNAVVDAASIETPRRARNAKTDRVDARGLLKRLMRAASGERVWATARVPSEVEEDRRQLHRELMALTAEATRHKNQINGLLAAQGIRIGRVPARHPERWAAGVKRPDGTSLLDGLQARLNRHVVRLQLVRQQIRALVRARDGVLRAATSGDPAIDQARQLLTLKGIGETGAWFAVMEVFSWRRFRNRRQVAALLGLTPTPFASGGMVHDQGISKAGNPRLRAVMLQLAWSWVRYQPHSALTCWFNARFAAGGKRGRRIGIVAVTRRLSIDLWRYLETGVVPEGAELKTTLRA